MAKIGSKFATLLLQVFSRLENAGLDLHRFRERAWRRLAPKEISCHFARYAFPGLAIALVTTVHLADDNAASPPGHPTVGSSVYRHHHGLRLAKELKTMWRQEERTHMKALPKDQRRGAQGQWLARPIGKSRLKRLSFRRNGIACHECA